MSALWQDLRYSARSLAKTPIQSAILLLLITLGGGVNLAVFTFLNAALLRPLPYVDADELVVVSEGHPRRGSGAALRPANFLDLKAETSTFATVTASWRTEAELATTDGIELVDLQLVLEDYFQLLRVPPILGRPFDGNDFTPDYQGLFDWGSATGRVVVVSHRFWQSHYGGDPGVLGAELELNGVSLTVVGVMPPSFRALVGSPAIWMPWVLSPEERNNRATHVFFGIARVRPGVGIAGASAETKSIYRDLELRHPAENDGWTADLKPLRDVILGDTKLAIVLVQGGSLLVLLIACLNIAAILGARAADREADTRLKRALGASPGRIARQALVESLMLGAVGGGLAGLAVAASMNLSATFELATFFPLEWRPVLDVRVLLFGLGAPVVTGLVFGLGPALKASRLEPRISAPAVGPGRSRGLIIVSQAALAMALLSSGGLALRSFAELQRSELGFEPARLLVTNLYRPRKYDTRERQRALQAELLEEVRAVPGVESAEVALFAPLSPITMNLRFDIEGRASESTDSFNAGTVVVGDDYFRTIGAALERGRSFGAEDNREAPGAVIIDASLAREYWPEENPVGRRLFFPYPDLDRDWFTIVGVVGDITQDRLTIEPNRTLYISQRQTEAFFEETKLLVRVSGDPLNLSRTLSDRVHAIDPDILVRDTATMSDIAKTTLRQPRLGATLMSLFAILALLMAAGGVYGLISHSVAQRTREIGVRMALGARPFTITRLVSARAAFLTSVGAVIGCLAAFASMRFSSSLLYGLSPADPIAYLVAGAILMTGALAGSYLPARGASRLDPSVALRSE